MALEVKVKCVVEPTICTEMDFRGGVVLVFSAISPRRPRDADLRGMEIDEIRPPWNFDLDLAAETEKFQHLHVVSGEPLAR
jgi:hypothetical protein